MKPSSRRVSTSFLVAVFLFLPALEAIAQTGGTFRPAGNMTTPRFLHASTLLADGRVLIAGGQRVEAGTFPSFFKTLTSAELYDPSTGAFTPTGDMLTPRTAYSGTFTLLADGRVLVTGGQGIDGSAVATAELYDPTTGQFTLTGSMTMARSGHVATLLNNGKVLIAGGAIGQNFLTSAELYDPSTGAFTATGSMSYPWADTATLLTNGEVLITRGNPDGPPPFLSSAELYDPDTGTFAFVGYMKENHTGPTAVLLTSGDVLVAGGDIGDGDGSSTVAELFDPNTDTFGYTGRLIHGREQSTSTLLRDGTVLFTGGHDFVPISISNWEFDHIASAELYDPVTSMFRNTGSMATGRELHAATLLNDGTVLITGGDQFWPTAIGGDGGRDPATSVLASAEIYAPTVLVPASIVTAVQLDRTNAAIGTSYSANILGSNLTPETFFDVRYFSPGSNETAVGYNWQIGTAASHDIPLGTALGTWTINGIRAHQIETDHTGSFIPVSAALTVSQ
jgi:hypothetical protein